jgi:N-acetyltransferase
MHLRTTTSAFLLVGGALCIPGVSPGAKVSGAATFTSDGELRLPSDYRAVLKGEVVHLRPLRAEDYDALYTVAADPLIWEQHPVATRHEEATFRTFFHDALRSGGTLIAIDAKSQRVIGSSRFHGYSKERREVEIGWTFLARSHWGGRYNGEMKRLMLTHAFNFVSRVIFLVSPQNIRSQRAVEKVGGIRAGMRRDAGGRNSLVYEIAHRHSVDKTLA